MARDSLDMSGSESDSDSILDSLPDGSMRLSSQFNGPTIHLLWRTNSHKFEDRIIALNEPVKVGRSVAKLKPTVHNAIFDCKVLSRNHALITYDDGKFYIQDTQSSNGTFVNNERLSKGSEESLPKEIYSGDLLQFGVDVIENSRKVTHGCIIALAKLYYEDGTEAKAMNELAAPSFSSLSCSQTLSLVQLVTDALQREAALREKVQSLQMTIEQLSTAAESSWQAMIDEERLLNKIENLEYKLASMGDNNHTPEVNRLITEKETYEAAAKESLSKVLQEKLTTLRKCDELQHLQKSTIEQLSQLQTSNDALRNQLSELADKCDNMKQEAHSMVTVHASEKLELESKVSQLEEECGRLEQTVNTLQEELEQAKLAQKLQSANKDDTPISEKCLTIEDAASESEDKISLDSNQGETKSNKNEIIKLEEQIIQYKTQIEKMRTDAESMQKELSHQKNLLDKLKSEEASKLMELNVQIVMLHSANKELEETLKQQLLAKEKIEMMMGDKAHGETGQEVKMESKACATSPTTPTKSVGSLAAVTTATVCVGTVSPSNVSIVPSSIDNGSDGEMSTKDVRRLQTELIALKESYAKCLADKVELQKSFDLVNKGGRGAGMMTMISTCLVPLVVLALAMIFGIQPILSFFTAGRISSGPT